MLTFDKENYTRVTVNFDAFPDFSYAGYEKNEKPIPMVPIKITLEATGEDDRVQIQSAIDEVSKMPQVNGFKGAILLKAGTYHIDNTLFIKSSGIVIRGEGQGEDGTILLATSTGDGWAKGKNDELAFSNASSMINFSLINIVGSGQQIEKGISSDIDNSGVNVADNKIKVKDASGFNIGDSIVITKTTNEYWVDFLEMRHYGWNASDYQLDHRRTITDIRENVLYLDMAMVDNITEETGGGTVKVVSYPGRLNQTGIENLRLQSVHKHITDERHTWTGIKMDHVINSWVRNVTVQYFSFAAVSLNGKSDFNTIQDCAMIEPRSIILSPRRYHFYIAGGTANLFQRCFSDSGRHDFVTNSRVAGPNVFLDCLSINSSNDIGPHHRWATGTLFDNISGNRLKAYNRGSLGSGHGWVGAQTLFWNSHSTKSFVIENPPGSVNWCIGCTGIGLEGNGYWASTGMRVSPRSLFVEQLEKRLGKNALNNIIIPDQASDQHDLWGRLEKWKGDENALKLMN